MNNLKAIYDYLNKTDHIAATVPGFKGGDFSTWLKYTFESPSPPPPPPSGLHARSPDPVSVPFSFPFFLFLHTFASILALGLKRTQKKENSYEYPLCSTLPHLTLPYLTSADHCPPKDFLIPNFSSHSDSDPDATLITI